MGAPAYFREQDRQFFQVGLRHLLQYAITCVPCAAALVCLRLCTARQTTCCRLLDNATCRRRFLHQTVHLAQQQWVLYVYIFATVVRCRPLPS
jgi:hypothetical protein